MALRLITGLIGFPVSAYIILKSGVLLKTAILLVAITGMYEFFNALKIKEKPICFIGYGAAALYMYFLDKLTTNGIIFTISIFTLICMSSLVISHKNTSINDAAIVVFGFFYCCFLLSNIFWVREHWLGKYAVWLIVISAWGCDTGAYFTGILIGRHKLAPSLSPKKTKEGAVGGVFIAVFAGIIYGLIAQKYISYIDGNIIMLSAVIVFVSAIFAQVGDLAASSVKRYTGIKDFSNMLPGHGGVLDRFDSILFTAPSVYCVLIMFDLLRGAL